MDYGMYRIKIKFDETKLKKYKELINGPNHLNYTNQAFLKASKLYSIKFLL